jgi:hypothetical protein
VRGYGLVASSPYQQVAIAPRAALLFGRGYVISMSPRGHTSTYETKGIRGIPCEDKLLTWSAESSVK